MAVLSIYFCRKFVTCAVAISSLSCGSEINSTFHTTKITFVFFVEKIEKHRGIQTEIKEGVNKRRIFRSSPLFTVEQFCDNFICRNSSSDVRRGRDGTLGVSHEEGLMTVAILWNIM